MLGGDILNPQSLNRYAYVLNNPETFIDPLGLSCQWVFQIGVGAVLYCETVHSAPPPTDLTYCSAPNGSPLGNDGGQQLEPADECRLQQGPLNDNMMGSSGGYGSEAEFSNALLQRVQSHPARPQTPWYKNSCVTSALGAGALHVGIDAIGLIPEAGGIARVIGHQAGYVGVVADQVGFKVANAFGKSTSAASGLAGLSDTSPEGLASAGLTVAGFIPGVNGIAAGLSISLDIYKTAKAIGKCN